MKKLITIIFFSIIWNSCNLRTTEEYYNLVRDLENQGEYEKAIGFLNKVIEKKPKYRPALINRGADKSEIGDYKGAIKDYKKILDFDPNNTSILMNIGNNYKRLEEYEKSIDYYTKALKTKGAIASDSSYYKLTINTMDKDSDYFVRKFEIQYERGISYIKNKQYELGISDLEKVVIYDYERMNTLVWLGESYLKINDSLKANLYLTEAQNNLKNKP